MALTPSSNEHSEHFNLNAILKCSARSVLPTSLSEYGHDTLFQSNTIP